LHVGCDNISDWSILRKIWFVEHEECTHSQQCPRVQDRALNPHRTAIGEQQATGQRSCSTLSSPTVERSCSTLSSPTVQRQTLSGMSCDAVGHRLQKRLYLNNSCKTSKPLKFFGPVQAVEPKPFSDPKGWFLIHEQIDRKKPPPPYDGRISSWNVLHTALDQGTW